MRIILITINISYILTLNELLYFPTDVYFITKKKYQKNYLHEKPSSFFKKIILIPEYI